MIWFALNCIHLDVIGLGDALGWTITRGAMHCDALHGAVVHCSCYRSNADLLAELEHRDETHEQGEALEHQIHSLYKLSGGLPAPSRNQIFEALQQQHQRRNAASIATIDTMLHVLPAIQQCIECVNVHY
jgi:hypothetical protein